ARVTDQDQGTLFGAKGKPRQYGVRHGALITDVTGQDHLEPGTRLTKQVACLDFNRDAIRRRIQADGDGGIRIGIRSHSPRGSGTRSSDSNKTGARAEIEDRFAGNDLRLIENIAGKCLATGPGE